MARRGGLASWNRKEEKIKQYPIQDNGLYHLTPAGWVRQDNAPFPTDRLETWSYQAECPSDDAKEQICLRRIWKAHQGSGARA